MNAPLRRVIAFSLVAICGFATGEDAATTVAYEAVGPNLVENASFEHWTGGVPNGWGLAEQAGDDWRKRTTTQSPDARTGQVSLVLPAPADKNTVSLSQSIDTTKDKLTPDTRLELRVSAKVKGPDTLHVVLSYVQAGKEQKIRRVHSGSGEWEVLSQEFWVPTDVDLSTFRLNIMRRPGSTGPALIDDVSLRRMAPKAQVPVPVDTPRPKVPAHGAKH